MCMQSVSLWAEATWYRLGGGRADAADGVAADAVATDAVAVEPTVTSGTSEPVAPAVRVEEADERVLVSR
jgi:hypothetical protein